VRGAFGVGLGFAVFYVLAAAPGGVWYDTEEIAAAAFRLGVSHPPGQALHTVLGKAATLLPLGSIVFRTNVLSAIGAGIAVALLGIVCARLARAIGAGPGRARAAGLAAAVALGTSDALVGQATRTEVYAPAIALSLVGLAATARFCEGPRDLRALGVAGLAAGLAATLHPPAGISLVLATAWLVVLLDPKAVLRPRPIVVAALSVVAGLLPLALLFLRCRGARTPCWTESMTIAEFGKYVAGRGYAHNLQGGADMVRALEDALAFVLSRAGYLPVALLGALALVSTLRSESPRRWGLAYLGAFLLPLPLLAVMAFEEENPDVHGYLLPTFALLFATAGAALASRAVSLRTFGVLGVALLVMPPALGTRLARTLRPAYVLPDLFVDEAMSEPPPRALLMTSSDQMAFGAGYAQLVEGDRPDVVVLVEGLCGTKRHWADAHRRRAFLDRRRARPRGAPSGQEAMAAAALELARGRVPLVAESAHWRPGAPSLGVVFDLDHGVDEEDAILPRALEGELERHRARYADGGDRVYRILRQRRAAGILLRGRPRAAARELAHALWELSATDRLALGRLPVRVDALRPEPSFRALRTPWISDESSARAQLGALAFQAGRSDLAIRALTPAVANGDAYAGLLLAEIFARDGRFDLARRSFQDLARVFPEKAALAQVGLALVDAEEGRGREARQRVARARRLPGAREHREFLDAAERWLASSPW
jgi:hypothetical protein